MNSHQFLKVFTSTRDFFVGEWFVMGGSEAAICPTEAPVVEVIAFYRSIRVWDCLDFPPISWVEDGAESNCCWWSHLGINIVVHYFFPGGGAGIGGPEAF